MLSNATRRILDLNRRAHGSYTRNVRGGVMALSPSSRPPRAPASRPAEPTRRPPARRLAAAPFRRLPALPLLLAVLALFAVLSLQDAPPAQAQSDPLPAPADFELDAANAAFSVTWTPVTGAVVYQINVTPQGGSTLRETTAGQSNNHWTIVSSNALTITNGTTYSVTIQACKTVTTGFADQCGTATTAKQVTPGATETFQVYRARNFWDQFTTNASFSGAVGSKHDVTLQLSTHSNDPPFTKTPVNWANANAFACEWTGIDPSVNLKNDSTKPTECQFIRGGSTTNQMTLTQAMIDNGGVVIAVAAKHPTNTDFDGKIGNARFVPASAPTPVEIGDTVWSATLNVKDDLDGGLGCFNVEAGKECSTTSVLSDDDFYYGEATYTVTNITDEENANGFFLQFDTDVRTALDELTLYVDGTPLDLVSATHTTGNTWAQWDSHDAGWAAGDTAKLSLRRTVLWSATLTPKDVGGNAAGCDSTSGATANKCSTTATLSDNDFELGGTTYTVSQLWVRGTALNLHVSPSIPDALRGYTLRAGTTKLVMADASGFGGTLATWSSNAPTFTVNSPVTVSLSLSERPGAPTGLDLTPDDRQLTASWTAPAAGDSAITGYDVQYKESSAPDRGPEIWSATLTVQETSTDTFGCHDLVSGKECTAATGLTANEFAYDGVTYQVISFTHDSTADYSLVRFNKSIPAGPLESVQLVVVEGTDRDVLNIHTLLENSLPNDTMRFNGALDLSVNDEIELELHLSLDPAAGWVDAGHTGTTASAVIGEAVLSGTLTVADLGGGRLGCGLSGSFCNPSQNLTDHDFTVGGTSYEIGYVAVHSNGELRVQLPQGEFADAWVLSVGGVQFAFRDATFESRNLAVWSNPGLSWSEGDTVKLELRTAALAAFTRHDVRVRAKSSVGAGPWSSVAPGTPTGPIRVRFNPTAYTAPEGGVAQVHLEALDDHPDSAVRVQVTATAGTATATTDYNPGPWTVTFPEGVNVISFKIPLVADTVAEAGGETFTLAISPGDGHTVSGGPATVTIVDALWADEMSPKDLGSGNVGCDNASTTTADKCEPSTGSAIGDDDFVLDGTTYTISKISLNSGTLVFALTADIPGALEEGYALHVDGTKLDLDDAVVSGGTATWTNTGLTWQSVGAAYVVSLRALPPAQTPWSATLTPQALTGGALGCNNALAAASDKCTATATLSDDDFLVDGTVYSVAVVFVGGQRLGFGLTVNIPDALKTGYSLTVDGSKFALADAQISGKNAIWVSNVPTWTAGTAVTLGMEPAVATPAINDIVPGHEKLTVNYTLAAGTEAGKIRWRVKSPQGSWQPSAAGEALAAPGPHVITGLTNGETYQVQINAVKGAASSGWSRIFEDAPEAASVPSAPRHLGLSARTTTITATWSVPLSDGGTDITGYDVQYKETAGTTWTDVTHTGVTTTAEVTGLTQGTGYDVRVRARNAVGASPWSTVASATTGVVTAPSAVGVLGLMVGDGRLTVSWRPPASDGGSDITGYDLEYKLDTATDQTASTPGDPNTGWVASALTPDTTTAELTGLTNGVAYNVRVRAKNSASAGPWNRRSVAPQAPTGERPRARIAVGSYTVADSGAGVNIGINLSIVTPRDVTVQVVTYDGTARAGEDFTGGPYSVTVPAGGWSADLRIPIISDSVAEGHEHFTVSIRQVPRVIPGRTVTVDGETRTIDPTTVYDYFLGSPSSARVTILDAYPDPRHDDPFQLTLTSGLDEEGGPIITASWTAPSPAPGHYVIWYQPVDARGPVTYRNRTVYPDAPQTRQVDGAATSTVLPDLENGRHYFVRLRAVTAQDYGPWNEPLAGIAGVPVPQWSAEPGAAADGAPAIIVEHKHDASFAYSPGYGGHIIQIRKAGIWDWEDWPGLSTDAHGLPQGVTQAGSVETTWTGAKRTTFTGVAPGFAYYVRLYAVLDGNPVSVPTIGGRVVTWTLPGAPEGLNATGGHRDGEILVTWSPPADHGGHGAALTGWDLQYVKSGSGRGWSDGPYLWPERTRALITGLEPGASYDLRLRAKNGLGDGPWATVMYHHCMQTLSGDWTVEGEWGDGCTQSASFYLHYYVFTLAESSEVTLTLDSAVTPFLGLREGAGRAGTLLYQSIGLGTNQSRIQATLDPGTYTIAATTYAAATAGDSFTLAVSGIGDDGGPPAAVVIPMPTAMTMSVDGDPHRTNLDGTEGWALEDRVHARLLFTLDRVAPAGGTTITFTRGGTARFGDKAGTRGDYWMERDSVFVPQGEQTSTSLYIFLHDDAEHEDYETIILTARGANPELTAEFTITIVDNDAPPAQSPGPGVPEPPQGLAATAQILGVATGHATDPLRHELVMRWTPPLDGGAPTYYQPAWQRVFDDGATVQVMTEWQEQPDGEGVSDAEHTVKLSLTIDDRFNTYKPPLGGHRVGTDVSAHYHYDLTVRACNEAGCSAWAPVLTVKAAKPGEEVDVPQGQRPGPPEWAPPTLGQLEPYNVRVVPGDGTLTVTWTVAPRQGFEDAEIRHALRWSQVSGVWANPADPHAVGQNDGISVDGGVTSYTITGLENGVATGVFVRSFTGEDRREGSDQSSDWVRLKGAETTPQAPPQTQPQQQVQEPTPAKTYAISATAGAAEGGSATLTITLSEAAPADGVAFTVTAGYAGQTAETADVGRITSPVTVAEGNSALDVSIPIADDAVDEDDESFTVTVAASTEGWEKAGDGKDTATITITDDDTAGVTVTPTTLSISEDGSGTYTVVLDSQPADDVFISPDSADTGANYDQLPLAFGPENWDMPQTITVSGAADDDADNESVTISHEALSADGQYNGIAVASVAVTVTDDDTPPELQKDAGPEPTNVQVTPGDGRLTVTWTVAPRAGVSNAEIRHALRWSQVSGVWANPTDPRGGGPEDGIVVEGGVTTYTITGLQNGVATGVFVRSFTGGSYSENAAASSQWVRTKGDHTTPKAGQPEPVEQEPPTEEPPEQQQQATPRTFSVSATASAAEGGSATLTITLSEAAPADGVAFTVTAGYAGQTAETADVGRITSPVTVAEGNSALDVSIPIADDAVDEDDESFTVTVAASTEGWEKAGDGKDTATITITDDDTAGVTVTPTTLSISEDGSGTYTVVLDSKPTADVTVTPTNSDGGAASVAPASYTFTPSDWNTAKTFTVSGVADEDRDGESVTVGHDVTSSDAKYDGIAADSVAVSVADTTPAPVQESPPAQAPATASCPEETEPPVPGQTEPYNICITPGDGTLTVTWTVAPREGVSNDEIRHALRWSQVSGVWANPAGPNAVGPNDGVSVDGGVYTYTITGLTNGVATGVFVRSFTGGNYNEGAAHSSEWVRIKGENTTPRD